MSTAQQPQAPAKLRKRRGIFVLGLFSVTLILIWWGGAIGRVAFLYANHLANQQQLLNADIWYTRATEWGNDSQDLWFSRARLARKLARDEEFIQFLDKAAKRGLAPHKQRFEVMLSQAQRGDLTSLRSQLADLLVRGDDADEICFAYAQGSVIKYHLDDAMQILELWEADYPHDPRPNLLRGRLFEHGINLDEAKAEFRAALDKNSKYSAAAYNLGRILETEQKPDEALTYYQMAAETLMNPVPGLIAEARCLRLIQQYDKAKSVLTKAAEVSSDQDVEAFRLLGDPTDGAEANLVTEQGYLAATMDNHEDAVRYLKEALILNPNDWRARYQLAISQRQIGDQSAARENFAKVDETKQAIATCDRLFDQLSKEPDNIDARLQIGEIFLKHLSENQGVVWLNSVLDLDPNNLIAHRTLAEYFRSRENDYPEFSKLAESHEAYLPNDQ